METWFILAVVGYLFYAISSSIDKHLMNIHLGPVRTNMFKMLFDGIILLGVGFFFFDLNITFELILWGLLLGVLYAGAGILYYKTLQKKDVEEAIPYLQSMAILFLFFASFILFGEAVTMWHALGVALIVAGVWSILAGGFHLPKVDYVMALVAGTVILFGTYALLVKKLLFDVQPIDLAITMYFSSAIVLAVSEVVMQNWKAFRVDKKTPLILFGAVFGALGTLILYSALAIGDASRIYPMSGLESMFVFIFATIFLKEKFSWPRLVGVLLICTGIFMMPM